MGINVPRCIAADSWTSRPGLVVTQAREDVPLAATLEFRPWVGLSDWLDETWNAAPLWLLHWDQPLGNEPTATESNGSASQREPSGAMRASRASTWSLSRARR